METRADPLTVPAADTPNARLHCARGSPESCRLTLPSEHNQESFPFSFEVVIDDAGVLADRVIGEIDFLGGHRVSFASGVGQSALQPR